MLLAIDVGNTNITVGLFKEENIVATFRVTTKIPRTSDEYGIILRDMVEMRGYSYLDVEAAIIASVVPDVMHSLSNSILKYFHVTPMIVGPGVKTGIRVATENPRQIGPDRIVDAVAAYELYGGPVIVVDFGTATTYDLVNAEGAFIAGVTSPGIRTSAEALTGQAAMLPAIEIKKPPKILAQETVSSMQAGIVYGYIGQTEYIIRKMKEEAGFPDIKVVATGGLGSIIVKETDVIDVYDSRLTMRGLWLISEKNRKR